MPVQWNQSPTVSFCLHRASCAPATTTTEGKSGNGIWKQNSLSTSFIMHNISFDPKPHFLPSVLTYFSTDLFMEAGLRASYKNNVTVERGQWENRLRGWSHDKGTSPWLRNLKECHDRHRVLFSLFLFCSQVLLPIRWLSGSACLWAFMLSLCQPGFPSSV